MTTLAISWWILGGAFVFGALTVVFVLSLCACAGNADAEIERAWREKCEHEWEYRGTGDGGYVEWCPKCGTGLEEKR